MYPATIFNLYDNSEVDLSEKITEIDNSPLFMVVGSFDKGPEKLTETTASNFNSLYGTMSFDRHGQNSIQCQKIINAGGRVLVKRVCADDATLANVIMIANLESDTQQKVTEDGELVYLDKDGEETTEAEVKEQKKQEHTDLPLYDDGKGGETTDSTRQEQKTDENGNKIYLDSDGGETTDEEATGTPVEITVDNDPIMVVTHTNDPVMITAHSIKWEVKSIAGCKTYKEVHDAAVELLDVEGGVFPLVCIADNGRGKSKKAIRLIPDYNTSKGIGKTFYTLNIFEGTTSIESVPITLDPEVIYSNTSYGFDENTAVQIKGEVIPEVYNTYIEKVAEALGTTSDIARKNDLIYGYTFKGNTIEGFTLDAEGVDLNADYGVELAEGSNGAFGDRPVNTPAWTEAIRKVYAGEVTDEVWDVDNYKIAAVCDANFPLDIKEAIAKFVIFRKDCMFFRDLGVGLSTFMEIKAAYAQIETRSPYIADYCTSYMIKDPGTKKNIYVTMMYDFAECLVRHLASSAHNPLAGTINQFVLSSAIKGTVNYTPIITPSVNQKQAMDDLRINYAIFENDNCVVQTLYTSNPIYSQLSFANNVLAIQEVARAVRTVCPQNRFSLVTSADMSSYAKAVSNVLSGFSGNFSTLEFDYTKDTLKASQKIFYASIYFAFHDWAQTEIFDLFAINNQ